MTENENSPSDTSSPPLFLKLIVAVVAVTSIVWLVNYIGASQPQHFDPGPTAGTWGPSESPALSDLKPPPDLPAQAVSNVQDDGIPLPKYNVDAYCARSARMLGQDATMRNICIDGEQTIYNGLKERWTEIPEKARLQCIKNNKVLSMWSYMMLNACIEQEAAAAENPSSFKP